MDSPGSSPTILAAGLRVQLERGLHLGALRYYKSSDRASDGTAGAALRRVTGTSLPPALQASCSEHAGSGAEVTLAWRSPTETLILSAAAAPLAELKAQLCGAVDACLVDQTGGISVLRMSGERSADVVQRIGSTASLPRVGEALTSRLAELAVLALCVRAGEILLLVDRVYADHLWAWIRESAADL